MPANTSPSEQDALIQEFFQCNDAALDDLYRHYRRLVGGYLYNRGARPADIPDLVLEVFLKLWRAKNRDQASDGRPQDVRSFRGLLRRIAATTLAQYFRRLAREPRQIPIETTVHRKDEEVRRPVLYLVAPDNPEYQVVVEELRQITRACLQKLDPDTREMVILRYMEDLPTKEVAETLHFSEQQVNTALKEAIQQLRHCLENSGVHEVSDLRTPVQRFGYVIEVGGAYLTYPRPRRKPLREPEE